MQRHLLTLFLLLAPPVAAETIVTPDEFQSLSTGKTLYFTSNGIAFGAEQYFPSRRVLWQYSSTECTQGHWYRQQNAICFVYENKPDPQCWHFIRSGQGYRARLVGALPKNDLYLNKIDKQPLPCPGPRVGS